jgi:hypothetical protein
LNSKRRKKEEREWKLLMGIKGILRWLLRRGLPQQNRLSQQQRLSIRNPCLNGNFLFFLHLICSFPLSNHVIYHEL